LVEQILYSFLIFRIGQKLVKIQIGQLIGNYKTLMDFDTEIAT